MEHNVFIAWSTDRMLKLAEVTRDWLSDALQSAKPFVSSEITPGKNWRKRLESKLKECSFFVACMSVESCTSPWPFFEAGVFLGNDAERNLSAIYVPSENDDPTKPTEVLERLRFSPFGTYQLVPCTEGGYKKLLRAIAFSLDSSVDGRRIDASFDRSWPSVRRRLAEEVGIAFRDRPGKPASVDDGSTADAELPQEARSLLYAAAEATRAEKDGTIVLIDHPEQPRLVVDGTQLIKKSDPDKQRWQHALDILVERNLATSKGDGKGHVFYSLTDAGRDMPNIRRG